MLLATVLHKAVYDMCTDSVVLLAATINRPSRLAPLTDVTKGSRCVAKMMPLLSGRQYLRVGCGPMDSSFHHANAKKFNKQILRPALVELGITHRVKGASMRLLRQSAMRLMLFFGGELYLRLLVHGTGQNAIPVTLNQPLPVPAAPKIHVKGVSKHDPDNATAMDTFYSLFCPGEYLQCVMMSAGYTGLNHSDFRWQQHFVPPGRGLYSIERIQQERPDVWQIISEQLVPGLESWVDAVKARGLHGLNADDRSTASQALLQWELLGVFLQDSAVHFFEHRHSQVYLQLPIFQNSVFTEWLLGDFRKAILQLEHIADTCYKHIIANHRSGSLLDSISSSRSSAPTTDAESEGVLHEMYALVMSDTDAQAAAVKAKAEKSAKAAEVETTEDKKPQAGRLGVITLPPKQNSLKDLWQAWDDGWSGCQPIRIYQAGSALYPKDASKRGKMQWLRSQDSNDFTKYRQLLIAMDGLVRARSNGNRLRAATQVIGIWERSLFSCPQCLVSTVPGLGLAIKDYMKGNEKCMAKQGSSGTKRDAKGNLKPGSVYIERAQLARFFQLSI